MPSELEYERFEDEYTSRFEQLAQKHGLPIRYKRDRAAIDLGLGLSKVGTREQSGVRVWFQLKGKMSATLRAEAFEAADTVSVSVEIDHLRFWYASPEPVYVAVYIESVGSFIGEDVRDLVDREWGDAILRSDFFPSGQKSVTVKVSADALLDDGAFDRMLAHRSMRIDGPSYKGRPLGHRFDPLRSVLDVLEPEVFERIVTSVLEHHHFRKDKDVQLSSIFAGNPRGFAAEGILFDSLEMTSPMFTEFGVGEDLDEVRIESNVYRAQGRVIVVALTENKIPEVSHDFDAYVTELRTRGADQFVLFANARDEEGLRGTVPFRSAKLLAIPITLGGLAWQVLMAPLVFLQYQPELRWAVPNYRPGVVRPTLDGDVWQIH
jgi:Domain of unknown function (DUF4365)